MQLSAYVSAFTMAVVLLGAGHGARAAGRSPQTGCAPSADVAADPALRARTEAETRRIAMAFFQGNVQQQDKLLAPDAVFWSLGLGYLDRSRYVALHTPKVGPVRGAPTSHKQTINHVIIEGDLADVDMENYVVWPDFTYDQKYNNIVQVQNGQICLLKIFADVAMAKAMLPDIEKSVKKQ